MSHNTRIRTATSALALAGAFLLGVAPAAQARPDPGPVVSTSDGDATVVRRIEVPTPVDDGALEPLQLGVAAIAGAAAAAGVVLSGQRLNRRRFA